LREAIVEISWTLEANASTENIVAALMQHGFAIIRNAMTERDHHALYSELDVHFKESAFSTGLFYGKQTKRFGRVLSRSKAAQDLALNDLAVAPARALMGQHCQDIQLNLTQAIEIHPGSYAQAPHCDQDIWLGADHSGEMMLNAMWALDDFTKENGATVIWPGSHVDRPSGALPDGRPVTAVMPKGSLLLFVGSVFHAGGANFSRNPRRGLVISYCLGWLKPCENPWLSYPPEVARDFSPALSRLIGYRQDAPSLNNVDGVCPSHLLLPQAKAQSFSENLTAEQQAMIESYNLMQMNALEKAA
jgi:ectoine hydroxylase-related dioxygenase (phytanoyl-CoA dioxygenase family)